MQEGKEAQATVVKQQAPRTSVVLARARARARARALARAPHPHPHQAQLQAKDAEMQGLYDRLKEMTAEARVAAARIEQQAPLSTHTPALHLT